MKNRILELLLQLRNELQNNQGTMAKPSDQVITKLNRIIAMVETENISSNRVLKLIEKAFKLLPSVIYLIKKYWNV